jgi:ribonuclease P protein component
LKNTIKKNEILRGRLAFQNIFQKGDSIKKGSVRIIFQFVPYSDDNPINVGFSVSKKIKKKIYKNRIKRIFREFYRLNKKDLYINSIKYKKSVRFIILFSDCIEEVLKRIGYNSLYPDLIFLFGELNYKIRLDQ